ncbi:hypothetical protein H2248_008970 [Termitomyces sp. 'cryptogamus']|nr:hypothetical protein H2248_008970 [Termitomyces sp. 'cryptogamus']
MQLLWHLRNLCVSEVHDILLSVKTGCPRPVIPTSSCRRRGCRDFELCWNKMWIDIYSKCFELPVVLTGLELEVYRFTTFGCLILGFENLTFIPSTYVTHQYLVPLSPYSDIWIVPVATSIRALL